MSPRRGGSGRRTTRWVTFADAPNTLVDATPEQTAVLVGGSTIVGSTILRIVGNIQYAGNGAVGNLEYAVGLLVASNSIDSADTDPAVILEMDWLYWRQQGQIQTLVVGAGTFQTYGFDLDVKGRRKMDEGETLFLCETATGQGAVSFVNLRVLVLNP